MGSTGTNKPNGNPYINDNDEFDEEMENDMSRSDYERRQRTTTPVIRVSDKQLKGYNTRLENANSVSGLNKLRKEIEAKYKETNDNRLLPILKNVKNAISEW